MYSDVRHYRAMDGTGGLVAVAFKGSRVLAWRIGGSDWNTRDARKIERHIMKGWYVPSDEVLT